MIAISGIYFDEPEVIEELLNKSFEEIERLPVPKDLRSTFIRARMIDSRVPSPWEGGRGLGRFLLRFVSELTGFVDKPGSLTGGHLGQDTALLFEAGSKFKFPRFQISKALPSVE